MRPVTVPFLLALTVSVAAQPRVADPVSGLIVGQVVDARSGRPIAGAMVSIGGAPPPADGRTNAPPRILTGSDGRFVFRGLPRGSFTIGVIKSGYADGAYGRRRPLGPAQRVSLTEGERVGDIAIPMWKNGAITGMVTDEQDQPVPSVQVRALRRTLVGGRARFVDAGLTLTDDRGIYRFGNLLPGEYVVGASLRHTAMPLTLTRDFRTATTPSVLTQAGGLPLPGSAGSILVSDVLYGLSRGTAVPPPPVEDRLWIYPPTFHPSSRSAANSITIALASGQERSAVDFQLQPSPTVRLSGFVSGPDGAMVGQRVRLYPSDWDGLSMEDDVPTSMTDREGFFVLGAVPEGRYSLRANARIGPGFGPMTARRETLLWADVSVSAGRHDISGIDVTLRPGLRAHGRFDFDGAGEKPTGRQLAQIAIAIEPVDGTLPPGRPVPPDVDTGSAEFTTIGVPAGRYLLTVAASPVGWMFKAAVYGGRDISIDPVEIELADLSGVVLQFTDRWTGVQGSVRDGKGAADPDAAVLLFPTDTGAWAAYGSNPRRLKTARPGKNGSYIINSVPPGEYYVIAIPDEYSSDWRDPAFLETLAATASRVTVGDGEKRTVELRTREIKR